MNIGVNQSSATTHHSNISGSSISFSPTSITGATTAGAEQADGALQKISAALQRQASAVESHSAQIVEISQEFGTTDSNLARNMVAGR